MGMYISFLYSIRAINNITMQRSHAPYELYFYKVSCNCQISGSTLPRPSCDLTLFDPNGADAPRLDDLTTFLRGLWQLPFFSALLHTAFQLCGVRKGILCWESTRLLTWWIVTEKHLGSQLFKMLKPKLSICPGLIPKNKPKNILPKNKQNDMQSVEVSLKTILKIMCQQKYYTLCHYTRGNKQNIVTSRDFFPPVFFHQIPKCDHYWIHLHHLNNRGVRAVSATGPISSCREGRWCWEQVKVNRDPYYKI